MENPCCSCKLTRVRVALQHRALTAGIETSVQAVVVPARRRSTPAGGDGTRTGAGAAAGGKEQEQPQGEQEEPLEFHLDFDPAGGVVEIKGLGSRTTVDVHEVRRGNATKEMGCS